MRQQRDRASPRLSVGAPENLRTFRASGPSLRANSGHHSRLVWQIGQIDPLWTFLFGAVWTEEVVGANRPPRARRAGVGGEDQKFVLAFDADAGHHDH